MLTLHTLASGSSGNALVISSSDCHILVDAGISCRRITAGLSTLGLTPGALDAVLITHTHSDHISGLQTLSGRMDCPIYAGPGVCADLEERLPALGDRLCPCADSITIGDVTVTRFPNSHDAPGASGFRLDAEDSAIGLLTDSGYVTAEARSALLGVSLLLLEANYDPAMLDNGPYPYFLKERIRSRIGHLSNPDAAAFACEAVWAGAQEIVLAHLSDKNNTPDLALETVTGCLADNGLDIPVSAAPRSTRSNPFTARRLSCRT